jgi:hypothetical protein
MMSSVVQLYPQRQAGNDAQLTAAGDPHLTAGLNAHARMAAGWQLSPPAAAVDDGEMHAVAVAAGVDGGGEGKGEG